ncbi:Uncharacterized protein HZ326_28191 [Fusarium oxysporum f. sp. albedinis]|nr:Uncharacterized protein HZ326_28191 [Fusarium oxysporum f. sp. albedinis]
MLAFGVNYSMHGGVGDREDFVVGLVLGELGRDRELSAGQDLQRRVCELYILWGETTWVVMRHIGIRTRVDCVD